MSFSFFLQWESDIVRDIYFSILTKEEDGEDEIKGVYESFYVLHIQGFNICMGNGEKVGTIPYWIQDNLDLQNLEKWEPVVRVSLADSSVFF